MVLFDIISILWEGIFHKVRVNFLYNVCLKVKKSIIIINFGPKIYKQWTRTVENFWRIKARHWPYGRDTKFIKSMINITILLLFTIYVYQYYQDSTDESQLPTRRETIVCAQPTNPIGAAGCNGQSICRTWAFTTGWCKQLFCNL